MGGGIRSLETIETILKAGVKRVILGTKALEDEAFLKEALQERKWAYAADYVRLYAI